MARELLIQDGKLTSDLDADHKTIKNLEGFAALDESGKVPASQLPSYVDDVLEFPAATDFPATGETGKIYVATSTGKVYRWSGSQYIEIANPDLTGYKPKQAAVSDPTASGNAVSFIDTISQDMNGVITPTKKTVATAVASSGGTGGSAGLMTAADKEKLAGIAAGAEVNVIETVKVNGTALTPSSKAVDITVPTVPTNVSAFTNDAGYLTAHQSWNDVKPSGGIPASDLAAAVQTSLGKADTALQQHQDITGKADDNAVVKLTGDQTITGIKTFSGTISANDGILATLVGVYSDTPKVELADANTGYTCAIALDENGNWALVSKKGSFDAEAIIPTSVSGTLALLQNLAPDYDDYASHTYAVNDLRVQNGLLFRCTTAHTAGIWVAANWALATVEDVLAALRTALAGKQDALSAAQLANIAAVPNKADASALRYAMPASVALVAENDAATLVCADRAVTNATIASGFATLNLTFPASVSGYVRDFYLRITVAAGESAPAISLPQGVTIENAGGAVPEIADGEASAASTTLVWFSETASGIFTAKSETVKAVV